MEYKSQYGLFENAEGMATKRQHRFALVCVINLGPNTKLHNPGLIGTISKSSANT